MSETESEKHSLTGFDEYVLRARQSVAGRDAIFSIVRALFENKLGANSRILVVGSGWGDEISALGKPNPNWRFVGVDLSEEMLEVARARFAHENLPNKIELHQTEVQNLTDENFDAATCILTLHFVPDDGAKLSLLQAVKKRLKPGAPFFLVDGTRENDEAEVRENTAAWKRHATNNGMPVEMIDEMIEKSKNFPLVTEQREVELLREAGFSKARKVYQGIFVGGWLCVNK